MVVHLIFQWLRFDHYTGPTLPDLSVPITPVRRSWSNGSSHCSRLQIPLKLSWAITIHKAQGLTLNKVVVDVGKKEFSSGLTYVACSRVRHLKDLLFKAPFPYERLSNLSKSQRLKERLQEDHRLLSLHLSTHLHNSQHPPHSLPCVSVDIPSSDFSLQDRNMCTPSPVLLLENQEMCTPSPPEDRGMCTPSPVFSLENQEMCTPSPPEDRGMCTPSPVLFQGYKDRCMP